MQIRSYNLTNSMLKELVKLVTERYDNINVLIDSLGYDNVKKEFIGELDILEKLKEVFCREDK